MHAGKRDSGRRPASRTTAPDGFTARSPPRTTCIMSRQEFHGEAYRDKPRRRGGALRPGPPGPGQPGHRATCAQAGLRAAAMLAEDADLPQLNHDDPALAGENFHEVLDDLASRSWLVRSDLGYLVLGREQGMALLKDRRLSFPSVELLELQGLSDGIIYERTTKGLMAQSGPAHARLRRLVSAAFTPRQVERLRPRLREYLAALWGEIAPQGRCEVVTALARPLPSTAIAELLGVPGDAPLLARWSGSLQAVFDMDMTAKRAEIEAAYEEVRAYVLDLVASRRREPGEDLMSALVHYERDGDRLTDDEIYTLAASIISGGTDTTESQLA